ncbi:hypothetical protein RJ639_025474 [Escallonia herrerae]|uniref:DC1 domain-containing protein n=1 Tax=Escallonia herrerae TaxID=1293975 RepID=A0AA88USM7_9ASTE|nr:hypothetical protein RJ639_025474 [Escallonia herrerae]
MKSRHFSHRHDLILSEVLPNLDAGETEGAVCYGCLQPITAADHAFFSCDECRDFFLHKTCAELPQDIKHAAHPTHLLELLTRQPFGNLTYPCDCCCESRDGFIYYCLLCYFCICVPCSLARKISALGKIKHFAHHHPLIFNEEKDFGGKEAICYWCRNRIIDDAYSCTDCNFFLYKTCLDLPYQIEHFSHPKHRLTLLRDEDFTAPRSVVHTVEKAASGSHITASAARSCYVCNVFCYHLTYRGRLKMCYCTLTFLN